MKHLLILVLAAFLLTGCSERTTSPDSSKPLLVGLLLKSKGNQYFVTVEKGAKVAASELGVTLLIDGPTNTNAAKQNEIVENWITQEVDVIAAAAENRDGLSAPLKKAIAKGIKVVTYDSDVQPEARQFFANQATAQGIGETLMDKAAELCGSEGEFAIITSTLTSANMNEWRKHIEARLTAKYPQMRLVATKPCDDQKDIAQQEANNLLSAHPHLKCIMAICSPAVPGVAEAVKQAGKTGTVKVLGLGLPSENRQYVKDGVTQAIILWKVEDLGYLTIHAAHALARGALQPGAKTFSAGRLGSIEVQESDLILGKPFVFTKENIDQFDF